MIHRQKYRSCRPAHAQIAATGLQRQVGWALWMPSIPDSCGVPPRCRHHWRSPRRRQPPPWHHARNALHGLAAPCARALSSLVRDDTCPMLLARRLSISAIPFLDGDEHLSVPPTPHMAVYLMRFARWALSGLIFDAFLRALGSLWPCMRRVSSSAELSPEPSRRGRIGSVLSPRGEKVGSVV